MSDTIRRPVAAVAASLCLLALSGCATLGQPQRIVDRICASGDLEIGIQAIETVIAAVQAVRETQGDKAPAWLGQIEAGLTADLSYVRAGCRLP